MIRTENMTQFQQNWNKLTEVSRNMLVAETVFGWSGFFLEHSTLGKIMGTHPKTKGIKPIPDYLDEQKQDIYDVLASIRTYCLDFDLGSRTAIKNDHGMFNVYLNITWPEVAPYNSIYHAEALSWPEAVCFLAVFLFSDGLFL